MKGRGSVGGCTNNRKPIPRREHPKRLPFLIATSTSTTKTASSLSLLYIQVLFLVVTFRHYASPCYSSQINFIFRAFRGRINDNCRQQQHPINNPLADSSLSFIPDIFSLRGGSNEEGKELIHMNETENNHNNNHTDDGSPKYFGLIHSVFQMNMDAKEELTTTDTRGNDSNEYEYDTESESDSDFISNKEVAPSSLDNEQVSPQSTLDTAPKVSTASSRLITDLEDDMSDTISSSEYENDVEEDYNNNNEDNVGEINDEIEQDTAMAETIEDDDTSLSENEMDQKISFIDKGDLQEEVETEEQQQEEEKELEGGNEDETEESSIELLEETEREVEEEENLPSIHEIVQEEWDMIPDTEVEDESDEIKSAQRIKERTRSLEEEEREQRRQIERERLRSLHEEEKEQRQLERERRRKEREIRRQEKELKRKKKRDRERKKRQEETKNRQEDEEKDGTGQETSRVVATPTIPQMPPPSFVSSGWVSQSKKCYM